MVMQFFSNSVVGAVVMFLLGFVVVWAMLKRR